MKPNLGEPARDRHILIEDSIWEFLEQRFGKQSPIGIGVSEAIRQIIRGKVAEIRQREVAMRDQQRTQVLESSK